MLLAGPRTEPPPRAKPEKKKKMEVTIQARDRRRTATEKRKLETEVNYEEMKLATRLEEMSRTMKSGDRESELKMNQETHESVHSTIFEDMILISMEKKK